jgi:hypothetical protein
VRGWAAVWRTLRGFVRAAVVDVVQERVGGYPLLAVAGEVGAGGQHPPQRAPGHGRRRGRGARDQQHGGERGPSSNQGADDQAQRPAPGDVRGQDGEDGPDQGRQFVKLVLDPGLRLAEVARKSSGQGGGRRGAEHVEQFAEAGR